MHHHFIDYYAYKENSIIHKLDPRAKIIVILIYTISVVTIPKYYVIQLIPFFILPIILITLSKISFKFIFKHILISSPFVISILLMGLYYKSNFYIIISNNFIIPGNIVIFFNILLKFILSVMGLIILVCTTTFPKLLCGLQKFYVPKVIILQLSFLYRYIFITIEEVQKVMRARESRSYGNKIKEPFKTGGSIIYSLFFRSLERAELVYKSMQARGFNGKILLITPLKFNKRDYLFIFVCLIYIFIFRFLQF